MEESRSHKSTRNFAYGITVQILTLVLNFGVRSVFIYTLDKVYLGVNGLFGDILTILSLAELGFGTAIIYSMYKPLAIGDKPKLQGIINLYRKVYRIIGIIVAILGLSLIPFFPYIIKNAPPIPDLHLIYLLFLANSVSSYFFAYKRSILEADQKAYICYRFRFFVYIGRALLQISVLLLFHSFLFYLFIQICSTYIENIIISLYVDKHYPYLNEDKKIKLPKDEINRIRKDVYALILSRIGRVVNNGSVNIIISSIVGIVSVGLYSNYLLVTGAILMILNQVSEAIRASVGNYIATESQQRQLSLFYKIDFCNFILYGTSCLLFALLINPFISIWAGSDYVLSSQCAIIIAANLMIQGILDALWLFRSTLGLFTQGKYRPLFSAALNILFSIMLGKLFGIAGVLSGTIMARLFVNLWYDPYIIFKYGFKEKPFQFYKLYIFRLISLSILFIIMSTIGHYVLSITHNVIINFAIFALLAIAVTISLTYILMRNSANGRFLLESIHRLLRK